MLVPVKMNKSDFVSLINSMLDAVKRDDSFQGFIEYDFIDEGLNDDEVMVKCCYTIGNSSGQGSLRIVGETE